MMTTASMEGKNNTVTESMEGKKNTVTESNHYSGPYKATRLWNDVIIAFRENLPCGRHRRLMRSFENCFSGSSATDWLLQYLKSNRNFGNDVKREKAVSLLNKLYSAGIFEEVKVSKTMQHKTVVQDSRLYRLLPVSPSKLKIIRLPLAPRNDAGLNGHSTLKKDKEPKKQRREISHLPVKKADVKTISKTSISKSMESVKPVLRTSIPKGVEEENKQKLPSCRIVPKVLSSSEISEVWKRTFIFRLKQSLGNTSIEDVLSEDLINGSFVMHNCVYLNKNGTVTNIAPADQLPQWVLSAMKCLARWPEHHEDGLPSYPGFEKDVFGVVKDYFSGLAEPLIPFHLYDAITNIFVMASSRSFQQSDMFTSEERESIIKNLWTTASLENVIIDLSKKYSLLGATNDRCDNQGFLERKFHDDCFQTQASMHHDDHYREMSGSRISITHEEDPCRYRRNRKRGGRQQLSRSAHSSTNLAQQKFQNTPLRKFGSTPNLKVSKFETAFGPDNRTVTRVFYQNGVCTDYRHCDEQEEHDSFAPIETHFSESTEDLVHYDHPVNFERVGSLELIHLNEYENKDRCTTSKLQRKVQKSKSFASRSETARNRYNFSAHNRASGNFDSLPDGYDGFSRLSRSVEAEPEFMWASQESICGPDRLHPVPEYAHDAGNSPNNSFSTQVIEVESVPNSQSNNGFHHLASNHSAGHYASHSSISHTNTPPFHSTISLHNYLDTAHNHSRNFGPGYRPVLDASKERSISAINLSNHSNKSSSMLSRNSHHMTSTPLTPLHPNKSISFGRLQSGQSLSTPLYGNAERTARCKSHVNSFINYPQTRLSEERVKNCLQYFTLLIAPGNRRKLHMLFKMMDKMAANPNLCLDYTQTTRSLVLETFYRSIIRSRKESDMDEMLALQMLSFMLDFYDDIFTPPGDFKAQVSERLKDMQRPQISYSPGQPTPLQYCQRKSVADYENEKNTVSRQAMEELLEGIVRDAKMTSKEKHKRLKQFQVTYPTIYKKRFPTHESEAEALHAMSKPKLKAPLVGRPMNRLKGLRL